MLAPYDTRTLYYKRTPLSAHQERYFGVEYASMDDVLRQSDVLLSFVPYSEESRKMLGARELALLKPSALFVNCGRGPTVDEVALTRRCARDASPAPGSTCSSSSRCRPRARCVSSTT